MSQNEPISYADLGPSRRIAYLRNFFAGDKAYVVEFVLPEAWDRPSFVRGGTVMGNHYDMGFTAPILYQGEFLVFMCAEVLVARTAGITEVEFFSLVDSIQAHLHLHICELDKDTPVEHIEAAVLAEQARIRDRDFTLYSRITTPEPWRSL